MRYFLMFWALATISVVILLGERGKTSRKPTLYLFPDMDIQARAMPQAESAFFGDGRVDRQPVAGTVQRGYQWEAATIFDEGFQYPVAENPALYSGLDANGDFYEGFPVEVDRQFIELGREKFEIFCQVCHGTLGDGKGVLAADGTDYTMNRGYFGNVANLTAQPYLDYPEGQLFDRITNGWNSMYPYKDKLTPRERWAVVAYLRTLQRAANASVQDVPEVYRKELGL